jgi:hypothetical protein
MLAWWTIAWVLLEDFGEMQIFGLHQNLSKALQEINTSVINRCLEYLLQKQSLVSMIAGQSAKLRRPSYQC